jgi:hypothetical protein
MANFQQANAEYATEMYNYKGTKVTFSISVQVLE